MSRGGLVPSAEDSTHLIEFLIRPDLVGQFPQPAPAAQAMPQWFKDMPAIGPNDARTVKKCPPFLEALTCGYILPIAVDVKVIRTATQLKVEAVQSTYPVMDMHRPDEYPGAPFGGVPLLKFVSPWIIKTPPGFSTLFLPPLNRFDAHLMPLAGVVETDEYYRPVVIPTVCFIPPGSELHLKAGTPLVQVFPFRRDAWKSGHGTWDDPHASQVERDLQANTHLYKEAYWRKKSYT